SFGLTTSPRLRVMPPPSRATRIRGGCTRSGTWPACATPFARKRPRLIETKTPPWYEHRSAPTASSGLAMPVPAQRNQKRLRSYDKLLIGGRWTSPSSSRVIDVISPTTEETVAHVPDGQAADIDAAVIAAREAFDRGPWPRMSPHER